MIFQDLDSVEPRVIRDFKENPNRSLSAIFRKLRSMNQISFIGDYPIMSSMVRATKKAKVRVANKPLSLLMRQSVEYRESTRTEKFGWRDNLLNL